MTTWPVVALILFAFGQLCCLEGFTPPEKSLIQTLISSYSGIGKYGRPIAQTNVSIPVEFSLELHSIIDVVDDVQPKVTIFCWLSQRWNDPMLAWDPKNFEGIEEIVLPISEIWSPDTTLYNGLYTDDLAKHQTAVVQQNGAVAWILPRTFKVVCDRLDEGKYPFDGLKCFYKFGSWTTSGAKITYTFSSDENDFSMATFTQHPHWRVTSHFASKNELYYACCPKTPFIDLSYHIKLRRSKNSSCFSTLFPLITLGIMTAVPFMMTASTTAKVLTSCMTFFSLFFYGIVTLVMTPRFHINDAATMCFLVELFNAGVAIILTSWINEMRNRTHSPPKCLATLCRVVAVFTLCRCVEFFESDKHNQSGDVELEQVNNNNLNGNVNNFESIQLTLTPMSPTQPRPPAKENLKMFETRKNRRNAVEWQTISDVFNFLGAFTFLLLNFALLAIKFPRPLSGMA